jgi:hypothetical protein
MPTQPVTDEIAAAFSALFFGGAGPSHSHLTTAFMQAGYGDAAPYDARVQGPNKQVRVTTTFRAARRRPDRARELVDALLVGLRVQGHFDTDNPRYDVANVRALRQALMRAGWFLTDDGVLTAQGPINLATGGRKALDEQLERLRKATDDPAQLVGSAKDLLEAVPKFVLEELGLPVPRNADFGHLWYLARERLGLLPEQVDATLPGSKQIKVILQSAWKIAEQVNELRNLQGTGHGRTLPTALHADLALLVVREACSVADLMLSQLDRQHGQ